MTATTTTVGARGEAGRVERLAAQAAEAAAVRALTTDPDVIALRVERVRTQVDVLLWTGTVLGLAFTMVNVQSFAATGAPTWSAGWWVAWLLDPMVSLVLLAVLRAEQITARYQVALPAWARRTKWLTFSATYVMNTWTSWGLAERPFTAAGVVLHSVPPLVVFAAAETGPGLRDRLTEAVRRSLAEHTLLEQTSATSGASTSDTAGGSSAGHAAGPASGTGGLTPVFHGPVFHGPAVRELEAPDWHPDGYRDRAGDRAEPVDAAYDDGPDARTSAEVGDQVREQVRTGDGSDRPDRAGAPQVGDLLTDGRAVADDLARRGGRLTRAALIEGLRGRGCPVSTDRAGALLAVLRLERSDPPHGPEPDLGERAPAGPAQVRPLGGRVAEEVAA